LAGPAGVVSSVSAPRSPGHRMYNSRGENAFKRSQSPQTTRRDSGVASKLIHNAGGMIGNAQEGSGGLRDDRVFLQSMGPKFRGHCNPNPASPRCLSPRAERSVQSSAGCFTQTERRMTGRARSCSPLTTTTYAKDDLAPPSTPHKKACALAEPTPESERRRVRQAWEQRYCEEPTKQPRRRVGDCSPRPGTNPVTPHGNELTYKAVIPRVNARSRVQEDLDHQGLERRCAAERDRRLAHDGKFADLCRQTSEQRLIQRQMVRDIGQRMHSSSAFDHALTSPSTRGAARWPPRELEPAAL